MIFMKLISKGKKQKVKDAIKRRDSSIFTKNNEGPQRIISTSTV